MKNKYRHNPDGSTTIFIESPKYGTKEALIDTDDFEKVNEYPNTWCLKRNWRNCSKKNSKNMSLFYANTRIPRRTTHTKLHHAIMGKPAKGFVTDHINGDGLDNRRENLRLVTQTENMQNTRKYSSNTHGYVGIVNKRKIKKKNQFRWNAGINVGAGRLLHLGTFKTKEEAAQAYDLAVVERRKIINAERQLNFPEKLKEYEALLATKNKCEVKKNKKQ